MEDTRKHNRFVKSMVGIVLAILLILTILISTLLAIRLMDYIKIDEREVILKSNTDTEVELFSVQYKNSTGEITVSSIDGTKLVAPGTSVDYTIYLRNKDTVAIDYQLIPDVEYTSELPVPLLVRMLNEDGEYMIGDAKTWVPVSELGTPTERETLMKNESREYILQWKWEFESGNDDYDTMLGSSAINSNIGISMALSIHAEANTSIEDNGGVIGSGLGDFIFDALLLLLLIVAIVLLIIVLLKKRKDAKPEEPAPEDQENEQTENN